MFPDGSHPAQRFCRQSGGFLLLLLLFLRRFAAEDFRKKTNAQTAIESLNTQQRRRKTDGKRLHFYTAKLCNDEMAELVNHHHGTKTQ